MMRSLYSGVAGLKTHQTKMDVIGNNISNVNTVGFKSTAVTFSDIMYQNLSGPSGATDKLGGVNAKQIGLGSLTAATKTTIESAGASQSTGEAFDIRLTDGNATNFFIVNDGTKNLFTRAGSFYIDGAGNLAMTSTGYMVQGWQAVTDPDTGQVIIRKDTVSPLRLLKPENQTSNPEATSDGVVSGILDKNDSNINSTDGYNMSFNFYDQLGYMYNAKFTVNMFDPDSQTYTIKLTSILDSNNVNILTPYIAEEYNKAYPIDPATGLNSTTLADNTHDVNGDGTVTRDEILSGIFGKTAQPARDIYTLSSGFKLDDNNRVYTMQGTTPYYMNNASLTMTKEGVKDPATGEWTTQPVFSLTFSNANANPVNMDPAPTVAQVYGVSGGSLYDKLQAAGITPALNTAITQSTDDSPGYSIDTKTGNMKITYTNTNFTLDFNEADGSFGYVDSDGIKSVSFNMSALGNQFDNINLDFSTMIAVDNGGTATGAMDRGQLADPSVGAGKALGQLNGISVQRDGTIFGSYSNGNTVLLGQIAVARFANPSGLESLGNNLYGQTLNSGEFDGVGEDITVDGGHMDTGQLEMSNVDLSREFTEMITTQRGFQANSRIITVSDTLLEELTNLKR